MMANDFIDFFDPYNPEHLAAYEYLTKKGVWPVGFVPDYEQVPMMWVSKIQAKICNAMVSLAKNDQIIGFAPKHMVKGWEQNETSNRD